MAIIEEKVYSCRKCGSSDLKKNGKNVCGNQQYHGKACGAYGVLEPRKRYTEEDQERILKAYQERPSMRGIERTYGVSRQTFAKWLKKNGTVATPRNYAQTR